MSGAHGYGGAKKLYNSTIHIKVSDRLLEDLETYAHRTELSVSAAVRFLIRKALDAELGTGAED